ncbi:MAG: hypothetical protein AABX33_06375 [Nanoarchaeota archaeon]
MQKSKILTYLFVAMSLVSFANAATISGTIYDLSLKKINNVRVEIDTTPKQLFIAQNGTYSFNVPYGAYTIKAQLMQKNATIASVREYITIKQDGSYNLDLILFPDIEEGIEDIDINLHENFIETKNNMVLTTVIFLTLPLILAVIFYLTKNKKRVQVEIKKSEDFEDRDLNRIISIIKQESGRTTQKEIRKQIPLSEAKISLMLAELEHKGIIEKIKKGRGNIIILKER